MPLRASLDESEIQSFNYSQDEWLELKKTYKNKSLLMPCCQIKAIPKTSKLGVQYFAHARRGECTSSPETAEHIHLKYLIAKTAQEAGWSVTTERPGTTPEGENWIADVFCEKGAAKLAFEVQWSYQTNDEYVRRTEKYRRSGVRCAWLFRLKANKEYYHGDFIESYDLPYFGFKRKDEEYIVSRFDVTLEKFVSGMLNGKLSWFPKENDTITAKIGIRSYQCWKCFDRTNVATSLDFYKGNDIHIGSRSQLERSPSWLKWLANSAPLKTLHEYGLDTIEEILRKGDGKNVTKSCLNCKALRGVWTIYEEPKFHIEFFFKYDSSKININSKWLFDDTEGDDSH